MKRVISTALIVCFIFCGMSLFSEDKTPAKAPEVKKESKQLIVWISGDKEVALKMVLMYSFYCPKNKWMDKFRLLVWGPAQKLLLEDKEVQAQFEKVKSNGIEIFACKGCADLYKISDKLSALGITVKYTGDMLANCQKEGWHVLTI